MTHALVTGSFDPITCGHMDLICRASKEYDKVSVVLFLNPDKTAFFTIDERLAMMKKATSSLKNVVVDYSSGMVVDYVRTHSVTTIVRGVRNEKDLVYEEKMAQYNFEHSGVETVFYPAENHHQNLSSTQVREDILHHSFRKEDLPLAVYEWLLEKGYESNQ